MIEIVVPHKEQDAKREITYQEAWNKIAEFMNESKELSFFINPWYENGEIIGVRKYTLEAAHKACFVADKKWNK